MFNELKGLIGKGGVAVIMFADTGGEILDSRLCLGRQFTGTFILTNRNRITSGHHDLEIVF